MYGNHGRATASSKKELPRTAITTRNRQRLNNVRRKPKPNDGPFPTDEQGQIIPGKYHTPIGEVNITKIEPAKHYDVISFARAMNKDFPLKVKQLFDPEREAVDEAIKTGLYISWRPIHKPYDTQDCQRVGTNSRCFCSHNFKQHETFTGREAVLKCEQPGCRCKTFRYMISRPEEAGEFWLRNRRNFDPQTYRGKCRCRHTHEEHDAAVPPFRCCAKHCGCNCFHSAFVCAACDQHWHDHHTVFETRKERLQDGRQVDEEWYPFSELPGLQHIALTGEDTHIQTLQDALPPHLKASLPANLQPSAYTQNTQYKPNRYLTNSRGGAGGSNTRDHRHS